MKIAIVYASQRGNTERAAECIQDGILNKFPFAQVKTTEINFGP